MLKFFELFIVGFAPIFATVVMWYKLLNKKIDFKNYKLYITLFLSTIISLLNYFNANAFLRIFTATIILMLFFKYLFRNNIQRTIITPIFSQLIIMISEMLFAILIVLIFKLNSEEIVSTQFGKVFSNISIAIIAIFLSRIPIIYKFYNFIINITDKISKNVLVIFSLITILIANILTMVLYYKIDFMYLLIFNTMLTVFCFSIVLYSFKTKNNYIKVYDKYNTTLNSLKEYEDILDRYRVSNHENKNQLLTIRNMLPKSNKKVVSYIDTIVENKLKDNDKVMLETAKIPAGGLRGLVYSKILLMKDLDIHYELVISSEIKTVDLINKIDDSTMLDICKIIGVYLDNAIQAVENLKDKYVNIEMYLENKDLVISISNNYQNVIDIEKIEEKGYTSKGDGHGYGLTLTKEIIDNNKKLSNQKKMSKEIFTQMLKIKM